MDNKGKNNKKYINNILGDNIEKFDYLSDSKKINIKNLKSDFPKACKSYIIDKNNNLYYKKIIKYKNNENKFLSKEEFFLVPTIDDLNQLLYKFHTTSLQSNYKDLKELFYKNKIGFLCLDTIIQEYIKKLPYLCSNRKNKKKL